MDLRAPPPSDTNPITSDFTIPYENFIGAVLNSSFRIAGLIRNESHGDVYAVEDLSPSSNRYEAKAYILRGVPPSVYKYRIRNLKRIAAKSSFVCSFDQNGRKFVVNRLRQRQDETLDPPQHIKHSALERRNILEFDSAFPALPASCESISLNFSRCRSSRTHTISKAECFQGETAYANSKSHTNQTWEPLVGNIQSEVHPIS